MSRTNGDAAPATVDPDEVAGAFSDDYLACRDLGHAWRHERFDTAGADTYAYERTLKCRSCRTRRRDVVTAWGEVVRRHYDYADGYRLDGYGESYAFRRDDFRREVMRRAGLDGVRRADSE